MQKRGSSRAPASGAALNGEISFLRLLMAAEVVVFHGLGGGGYLAVDFFFMLSGCFAVRRALAHPGAGYADAARWSLRKFARIYPYVVPISVAHILALCASQGKGLADALRTLAYESFQIALLSASGLFSGSHNFLSHLWYLSCLLMLLPVFFSLLVGKRELFLRVLAPLSALFFYGYCARACGGLGLSHEWNGLFLAGPPRAWAGLCCGALVYSLAERIGGAPLSKRGARLLAAIELFCLLVGLAYMRTQAGRMLDFLCAGLWIPLAAIALSGRSAAHALFAPLGRARFIGDYCLALYVSHWTIPVVLRALTADGSVPAAPYLLLSALYAALWVLIVSGAKRLRLGRRLTRLFT